MRYLTVAVGPGHAVHTFLPSSPPGAPDLEGIDFVDADEPSWVFALASCVGRIESLLVRGLIVLTDESGCQLYCGRSADGCHYLGNHDRATRCRVAPGDGAQQLLTSSEGTWKACASQKVDATFGYESGAGYVFSRVVEQADMITLAMASTNNMGPTNGADACQQALAVRQNVVVEVRTCQAPNLTSPPNSPNPAWAVADAERVAEAMLANIKP